MSLKSYYRLTKPGIIYANSMAAGAGFLLAAQAHVDFWLLVALLLGTALVIASGCVFNNYVDRGIDSMMSRTRRRPLVKGTISGSQALVFAAILGIVGFMFLATYTNALVVAIGAIGLLDYVIAYGYFKRQSVYGTLVGSISGATPPVAGYVAVTGHFDLAAWLLFAILTLWQMPHFYAIAMYRFKDYVAAGLPVLPVKKGNRAAKLQIVAYIAAFIVACILLTVYGYTGYTYLVVMVVLGGRWLISGIKGFAVGVNDVRWARGMFFQSLLILLAFCVLLAVNVVLP